MYSTWITIDKTLYAAIVKDKAGTFLAGRVGRGESRGRCVSCHSQADGADFLYSNDH
jgi:hypothetical protein